MAACIGPKYPSSKPVRDYLYSAGTTLSISDTTLAFAFESNREDEGRLQTSSAASLISSGSATGRTMAPESLGEVN